VFDAGLEIVSLAMNMSPANQRIVAERILLESQSTSPFALKLLKTAASHSDMVTIHVWSLKAALLRIADGPLTGLMQGGNREIRQLVFFRHV